MKADRLICRLQEKTCDLRDLFARLHELTGIRTYAGLARWLSQAAGVHPGMLDLWRAGRKPSSQTVRQIQLLVVSLELMAEAERAGMEAGQAGDLSRSTIRLG